MTTHPQLERYLLDLDKALGPISMSERAEIVTEIKSHIMEAERKSPEKSTTQILEALGSPEQVANRYLLERGLKPIAQPKSRTWAPVVKWLTIGTLGITTISAIVFVILIWKFSPIIKIDGEKDTVSILGGLISIDGKEGKVQVGSTTLKGDDESNRFEGKKELKNPEEFTIQVPFSNGKFDLVNSLGTDFSWSCKTAGSPKDLFKENKKNLTLDLSGVIGSKCTLSIPKGINISLKGANAKISIEKPRYHLDVSAVNGKVSLLPDPNLSYLFDTKVANGKSDSFDSKHGAHPYKVAIKLSNGIIESETESE